MNHCLHEEQSSERSNAHQRLSPQHHLIQVISHSNRFSLLQIDQIPLLELIHGPSSERAIQISESFLHRHRLHAFRQHELHVLHALGQDHAHRQLLDVHLLDRRAERDRQREVLALLLQHAIRREIVSSLDRLDRYYPQ